MTLQKVRVVQDQDGHNYVIPMEMSEDFSRLNEEAYSKDDQDLYEEMEEKFGRYGTGGDVNNVQLYAEID